MPFSGATVSISGVSDSLVNGDMYTPQTRELLPLQLSAM